MSFVALRFLPAESSVCLSHAESLVHSQSFNYAFFFPCAPEASAHQATRSLLVHSIKKNVNADCALTEPRDNKKLGNSES